MSPVKFPVMPKSTCFVLNRLCFLAAALTVLFMGYAILTGFPPEIGGHVLRLKNLKTPVLLFLIFSGLTLLFHPSGPVPAFLAAKDQIRGAAGSPKTIWAIFIIAAVLLTWQQLTEYFAAQINFLPYSFYDYMLYYYFQGKIHYTGLLHNFYHANNILLFLAPLWKLFPSSLFLSLIYGPLAAAAVFPLYGFAKDRLGDALAAAFTCVLYLNYRYLQNVMQMNFSVEIFYSLLIFSAAWAAAKKNTPLYYLSVVLGLLVKEDSFIYFSGVGLWILIAGLWPQKKATGLSWAHGGVTIALSLGYYFFLTRVFMPLTGSNILSGDLRNFEGFGTSEAEILFALIKNPLLILNIYFNDPEKLKTYWNLLYRLAFLPLLTPAFFLLFVPLFPLFLHLTGGDTNFFNLRFHYAAAVLPFIFIAFIYGFSALLSKFKTARNKEIVLWGSILLLLGLNGGNYRTEKITAETLKSIHWAQNIPPGTNLVTHGHLLPYIGYRRYNYYFAEPFELAEHPAHGPYVNADYYLIDTKVNPYPMDARYVENKIRTLKEDLRYELVLEDSKRFLFRKKKDHA